MKELFGVRYFIRNFVFLGSSQVFFYNSGIDDNPTESYIEIFHFNILIQNLRVKVGG